MREVGPGEIFGHDELVHHFEYVMKMQDGKKPMPKRLYRVIATEKTDLLFLSVAKFYYFFNDTEL